MKKYKKFFKEEHMSKDYDSLEEALTYPGKGALNKVEIFQSDKLGDVNNNVSYAFLKNPKLRIGNNFLSFESGMARLYVIKQTFLGWSNFQTDAASSHEKEDIFKIYLKGVAFYVSFSSND